MQAIVHVCTHRSAMHTDNEDRAVIGSTVVTTTSGVEHATITAPAVIAVLDGLGGHPAGDVASDRAAHVIAGADPPGNEAAASALLARADRAIHETAREQPTYLGMGTTVSMVSLVGDRPEAVVANVGDSAVYSFTNGSLVALSTSDRGAGGGLWQCLGAHEDNPVNPHARHIAVAAGDLLLLATDGLTDVVSHDTVESVLRDDADNAARRLLMLVDEAGSPDDVTIVVVQVLGT